MRRRAWIMLASVSVMAVCGQAYGESPFATRVVDYSPAPGQFVNNESFNDPHRAIGPPQGAGAFAADNTSVVSLGGFGGTITLAFDHTVMDDALNPLGLDAIVFSNAFWIGGNPQAHWAELATIEICLDANGNGQPDEDEPWYLIPGSHLPDPNERYRLQTWDDDVLDDTYPPQNETWIPPDRQGVWDTFAYELPPEFTESPVLQNPSEDSEIEGVFGYAEYSPTLALGDTDADNVVDDPGITAEEFYTVPDDPKVVGMTPGSGGGDAFDIAWAVDPTSGQPARLLGFDFVRITTALYVVADRVAEFSAEIDAVADVAPDFFGDFDGDGDRDLADLAGLQACFLLGAPFGDPRCEWLDRQGDGVIDGLDLSALTPHISGPR